MARTLSRLGTPVRFALVLTLGMVAGFGLSVVSPGSSSAFQRSYQYCTTSTDIPNSLRELGSWPVKCCQSTSLWLNIAVSSSA